VAALLKIAVDALHVVHPSSAPGGPTATEIEEVLRTGTQEQRQRAVAALRQLESVLRESTGGW
jgi:hypothetical protein